MKEKIVVIGVTNIGRPLSDSLVNHNAIEVKQLNKIIEEEKSIKIIERPNMAEVFPKDGKAKRRDRRKNNR